jgi:hypothetical protein
VAGSAKVYTFRGMNCAELVLLRQEVSRLFHRLRQQRERARAKASLDRGGKLPGRSDYESYLQRRLDKVSAAIDQHVAIHDCE